LSRLCENEAFSTPHGRACVVAACSQSVAQAPQEAGNGRWHPELTQDVHRLFKVVTGSQVVSVAQRQIAKAAERIGKVDAMAEFPELGFRVTKQRRRPISLAEFAGDLR
jgi:hypothetical protein